MTSKQFLWARAGVALLLGIVISQAVILDSYILGGVAAIIAFCLLLILKHRVKEVLADERDYKLAGDAARWTLYIFSMGGWLLSFVMIALRKTHPGFESTGFTLAYAVCALLVIDLIVTMFLRRTDDSMSKRRKLGYAVMAVIVAIMVVLLGLRVYSPEDDWICQNGSWVQHGHPSTAKPTTACS